jgi:hypothetical protein
VYLNDIAEQTRVYKVVTHTDHRQDHYVAYFDDYDTAFEYWRKQLLRQSSGQFTASATLIKVATGEPILRQTWRL